MATGEYRIRIATEFDATRASMQARRCALEQGFDKNKVATLTTVASELATNILKYAGEGHIILRPIEEGTKIGLLICAFDQGPGIKNVDEALQDHKSTSGTLGLGLPSVKRMMDEFEIITEWQNGTTVTVKKWK